MEKFESTKHCMELLKSGQYKCLVMENEEEVLKSEEDFKVLCEAYKAQTALPDNYDYLLRRQVTPTPKDKR